MSGSKRNEGARDSNGESLKTVNPLRQPRNQLPKTSGMNELRGSGDELHSEGMELERQLVKLAKGVTLPCFTRRDVALRLDRSGEQGEFGAKRICFKHFLNCARKSDSEPTSQKQTQSPQRLSRLPTRKLSSKSIRGCSSSACLPQAQMLRKL